MIYLVEDDESIRELVVYTLNSQGLEAQGFERPSLFWKALEKETAFTGASGHYASGGRRTVYFKKNTVSVRMCGNLPVIMLTAKGKRGKILMLRLVQLL